MEPDPNAAHPIPGYDKEIYVRPTVKNPQIEVGCSRTLLILTLKVMCHTCTRGTVTSSDLAAVKQRIRSIID